MRSAGKGGASVVMMMLGFLVLGALAWSTSISADLEALVVLGHDVFDLVLVKGKPQVGREDARPRS
jgi:hypothetical protein